MSRLTSPLSFTSPSPPRHLEYTQLPSPLSAPLSSRHPHVISSVVERSLHSLRSVEMTKREASDWGASPVISKNVFSLEKQFYRILSIERTSFSSARMARRAIRYKIKAMAGNTAGHSGRKDTAPQDLSPTV